MTKLIKALKGRAQHVAPLQAFVHASPKRRALPSAGIFRTVGAGIHLAIVAIEVHDTLQTRSRMTRRPKILLNYAYSPWSSYRYCEDALCELADVTFVGSAGHVRPGFPLDQDINEYIAASGVKPDFYLSTERPLHRGLPEVECPTALLIADYWPGDVGRIQTARLFDHVFVTARDAMRDFPMSGCKSVHFVPFAADLRFHRDFHMERTYDVGFVGYINQQKQQERARSLAALSARFKMNDFTKPAFGEEVGRTYSQSKIVVNYPQDGGFNMRVFEAMACGALLITEDVGKGQDEFFQDRKHFVLYRRREEIPALVEYYLAHEEERLAIAAEGQREVLAKHTYRHRMASVLRVMSELGHERNRASDRNEIIKVYAASYSRMRRLDYLIEELFRGRGSLLTRFVLLARLLKTVIAILRSPRR